MTLEARKRILVVDDSFIMRKLVCDLVESDPELEVVDTAEDGRIALQKVRECRPDLVLLDIEMPEMSGLETLRRLGLRSKTKVIILSSLGQKGSAESIEALRLGASAVLAKPSGAISLDLHERAGSEIIRTIRDILGLAPLVVTSDAEEPDGSGLDAGGPIEVGKAPPAADLVRDLLLGALTSGVMSFDRAGRLSLVNDAAQSILGLPDIVVGEATLDQIFADYNESLGTDIREVIATGEGLPASDNEYCLSDGSWRPIRILALPMVLATETDGVLVLIDDMTRDKEVRKILSRTLSDDVAAKLLSSGSIGLGGAMETASILFSDIRQFTNLSETLGPAGIVEMLNEYFSFMEDILKSNGGVIDKYIGDAIMALFGVPAKLGKDADRAVKSGQDMISALELLNDGRRRQGKPGIAIGVGISTGQVIAGNIGSPTRMNYTVIGDTVNLASRIESLTKQYGAELLICGDTMTALSDPVQARKVDVVRVKGQNAATVLYQVFQSKPSVDPGWLHAYSSGFDAYVRGEWAEAQRLMGEALSLRPDDKAAMLIVDRCATLAKGPASDWDGVWAMQEK